MLKDGARIVVLAEQEGPPPAWYHHMWDLMQDTPFTFQSVAQMSCELLRGQQDNDLFLVNHWLQAPLSPGLDDLRSSRSGMHFLRARSARGGTPFRPRRPRSWTTAPPPPRRAAGVGLAIAIHMSLGISSPELAAVANEQAVLEERVRRCAAERGKRPNVLAVDHVDLGALFAVVDALNGVE